MGTIHHKPALAAAAAALASLALAGCDAGAGETRHDAAKNDGRVEAALERTQQNLAEAGAKTRDMIAEANDKLPPKLAAAGEKIQEAGGKVAENLREAVKPDGGEAARADGKERTTTTITTGPKSSVSGIDAGTRAKLSDAAITASIKAGYLKDPDLGVFAIDVDTRDGVVTLDGTAPDEAARRRAAELAGATKGVREVRNQLTVKRG